MKAFKSLTSQVTPLPLKDVDTDMILPSTFLTSTSSTGYGEHLFTRLRKEDPEFPLNQERFHGSQILVARGNFGCGSSREHAVWSLMEYGYRVIIAPDFADIFKANAGKNGLILIELPEVKIEEILEAAARSDLECPYEIHVDLPSQTLTFPDATQLEFPFDPFRKICILGAHQDIDYLLEHMSEIEAYQKKRAQHVFVNTSISTP
jgi:3-isopropylmalate/(R)-2-methylmalate dehydratase small subunit